LAHLVTEQGVLFYGFEKMSFSKNKYTLLAGGNILLAVSFLTLHGLNEWQHVPRFWGNTLLELGAVFGVLALLFSGLALLRKRKGYRLNWVSWALLALFLYFNFYQSLLTVLPDFLARHRYLGLLWLGALGLAWSFPAQKKGVQFTSLCLLFFLGNEAFLAFTQEAKYPKAGYENTWTGKKESPEKKQPPIILIVMDAYTANASLQKFWGFDNRELIQFLEQQGFYVPKFAYSPYNRTSYTLAAMLNGRPVADSILQMQESHAQLQLLFQQINDSQVLEALKQEGYSLENASIFHLRGHSPAYSTAFLSHTLSDVLLARIPKWNTLKGYYTYLHYPLKKVVAAVKSNTFVYAHCMAPHGPYFYNAQGELQSVEENLAQPKAYLEYLKYCNQQLASTLTAVLQKEPEAIILITGDHGYRYLRGKNAEKEAYSAFFAVRLPKEASLSLGDSVDVTKALKMSLKAYFKK